MTSCSINNDNVHTFRDSSYTNINTPIIFKI